MLRRYMSETYKFIRSATINICWGYCFLNFVAQPILVPCSGPSMEPTIDDKDVILTDRFSAVFIKKYKRGDIVIARMPSDPQTLICKRVVGVSGDIIKQGFLSQQVVPRGYLWIHGDNDNNSTDSRYFGAIPEGLIFGKAIAKIWPPNHIEILK